MAKPAPADFTPDEFRRMQRTLRRRFQIGKRRNLIDVGFGIAVVDGRLQPTRGVCAAFFVQKKRAHVPARDRVPASVQLRLKRANRYATITLPTDVIETGLLESTGARVDYQGELGLTGVVVAWTKPGATRRSWGLLAAGHLFPPLASLTQSKRIVLIETAGAAFGAILAARSSLGSRIDAALLEVDRADLEATGLLDRDQADRQIDPRPLALLVADPNRVGETLRMDQSLPFRVHAFLPSLRAPGLGTLDHVLSAFAARRGAFAPR